MFETRIDKVLCEYLSLLAANRKGEYALSDYTVQKPWGWERWLDLNDRYAMKMIHMKAGCRSSLQSHIRKIEANIVIEGEALVFLDSGDGEPIERRITVGEGWCVPAAVKHRVTAVTDYIAIEVSTPELNDVIRYQDDSGRGDGKIGSEHAKK